MRSTFSPSFDTPYRGKNVARLRLTCKRLARSSALSWLTGVWAAEPSRLALVMRRSATRRSSLALASVVTIRSWVNKLAARFRNIARRCEVFRPNCRPSLRWRMILSAFCGTLGTACSQHEQARKFQSLLVLLLVPAIEQLRPVVDLHAER